MRTQRGAVLGVGAVVVAIVAGMIGCSTGPKGYSFGGNWQASGGALNGDVFSVVRQTGDTVSGCQTNVPASGDTGAFEGVASGGQIVLAALSQDSGYFFEFSGQFVNANEIQGSVGTGAPTTTLTRITQAFTCQL